MASMNQLATHTSIGIADIVIDPNWDFLVKVTEYDRSVEGPDGNFREKQTVIFKVKRSVLREHSAKFEADFHPSRDWDAGGGRGIIDDESVLAIEFCFRVLHGATISSPEMVALYTRLEPKDWWFIIGASRTYDFRNTPSPNPFFDSWFICWPRRGDFEVKGAQVLLFPTHEFDHAKGFAAVTKKLAYCAVGHIAEVNPTHLDLHSRWPVLQQLNLVRARLKSKIHRGLFEKIEKFLEARCRCKEHALWEYCKGLQRTDIWPLEDHYSRTCIHDLNAGLSNFSYSTPAVAVNCSCGVCAGHHLTRHVMQVQSKVRKLFDGLCLDCMNQSVGAGHGGQIYGNADASYWEKEWPGKADEGCRISHSQPSWFHSFMGRREDMEYFSKYKRPEGAPDNWEIPNAQGH